MAELLYKAAAPQGDGAAAGATDGAAGNGEASGAPENDDVIDAEFKEAK